MAMNGRIRINCKRVYESGLSYLDYSEKIENIQKDLATCAANIEEAWTGYDNHNFRVSFETHIGNLDTLINYLGQYGELLKKNALDHSGIDTTFATKMERSDIDEV